MANNDGTLGQWEDTMSQRWDSAGKHRLFRSSSGAPAQSVLEQLFAAVDMVVYPQLAHSLHGLNGPCPHYVNILIDFFPPFLIKVILF